MVFLACRLIDVIENEPGFPPCLVLLKGTVTLEDWLRSNRHSESERKAVLDQVKRQHSLSFDWSRPLLL